MVWEDRGKDLAIIFWKEVMVNFWDLKAFFLLISFENTEIFKAYSYKID
jgi:hypothetical protein